MIKKITNLFKILFYSLFFFLPLLQYLNKNNIQEFIVSDILYFLISLSVLYFSLYFIYIFIFKRFNYHFLFLILFFNLLFYFISLRDFFLINLGISNYKSIFLTISIYLLFLFLPLFKRKSFISKIFFTRFSTLYFLMSLGYLLINQNSLIYNYEYIFKENNENTIINFKNLNLFKEKNKQVSNIYFVIVDAMLSFKIAEELRILTSNEINNELEFYDKNNFQYINNSFSNYDTTQLTLASILKLDYFTKFPNEFTYKKSNVFPVILYHSSDHPLLNILKYKKFKFYHHGNYWGPCRQTLMVNCYFSQPVQIMNRVLLSFYANTPFYFFSKILKKIFKDLDDGDERQLVNYQNNFSQKEILKENKFIFIHHYAPHTPYNRKSNCEKKNYSDDNFNGYINSYKCTLKEIRSFIKFINNKDPNALIIIQADHGYKDHIKKNIKHSSSIYNLIKYPKNCQNLKTPRSNINSIIFVVNCAFGTNLKFKEFKFYEDGYDFPNAKFILKKHSIENLK